MPQAAALTPDQEKKILDPIGYKQGLNRQQEQQPLLFDQLPKPDHIVLDKNGNPLPF